MPALEPEAEAVLDRLIGNGHEAYVVGGFVRDALLHKPTQDIDIATSARPEETMALFDRTVPTGLKHGTVTVLEEDKAYEVTTFRTESEYEMHRRPKEVTFVRTLQEDLQRRDFTMNAMAMDRNGRIIDPFGGRDDLNQRVVRCVGKPEERFREDALRMMRAIRFAANYGFQVENDTWNALLSNRELFCYVAMERIYAEWQKIMEGNDPLQGLTLLVGSGLLNNLKLPLFWPVAEWGEADIPSALASLNQSGEAYYRWAMLFKAMKLDQGKLRRGASALTMPAKQIGRLAKLMLVDDWLKQHGLNASSRGDIDWAVQWKKGVLEWGPEPMLEWRRLAITAPELILQHIEDTSEAPQMLREVERNGELWIQELPAKEIKELAVGGRELVTALQRREGPWVGEVLKQLLAEVVLHQLPNREEELLGKAKTLVKVD